MVDSKLRFPLDVAHDLSGFFPLQAFQRSAEICSPPLPEERRSGGRVPERSSPSGARTQPRA
jgi:hypothetical protein